MTPEEDPFAAFAAPREQLSPVEAWKRRRIEEARQWRWLRGVGLWLLSGIVLGSIGAAIAAGSLASGGALLAGTGVGIPAGLAAGWLAGFGSWGGRLLRGTRLVPTSEVPVPMIWLAICSGIGLVTGAAVGSGSLPYLLVDQAAADKTVILGPVGASVGGVVAMVVAWVRGSLRPPAT